MKIYLGLFGGFAAVCLQLLVHVEVHARGAAQSVCTKSGSYAVFAQHPISILGVRGSYGQSGSVADSLNLQQVHEHIFFCNSGQIVENVGFRDKGRFSYASGDLERGRESNGTRLDDFVPIDSEQYDSDIIREIVAGGIIFPNRCDLNPPNDGTYRYVVNNCQGWTARVREEYWNRVKPNITAFYCEGQENASTCHLNWEQPTTLIIEYSDRGKKTLNWQVSGFLIGAPTAQGTVPSPNGDGSINTNLACQCSGNDCRDTRNYTMTASITNERGSQTTAALRIQCQPGAGQIIQDVIPKLPIPLPRLPF